jgi:hypothetical protein
MKCDHKQQIRPYRVDSGRHLGKPFRLTLNSRVMGGVLRWATFLVCQNRSILGPKILAEEIPRLPFRPLRVLRDVIPHQEVDEGRKRVLLIAACILAARKLSQWDLLRKGQSQGTVRRDLNPDEAASFLIAMVEGYASLAKNAQDAKVLQVGIRNIVGWLRSLRALGNRKRG